MIVTSRAIVLHQVKYSETSLIVTLYTEVAGRQSYIINGIRSSKSKLKTGYFQPLFLLEIEAYHKQGREIQRMKEFRILESYRTIPFEIAKSTTAMFLSEVLNKVIRNEEPDPNLFEFIIHSLEYFDSMEKGSANFHLWFLTKLSSYLGFHPENNYEAAIPWFDMKRGQFVTFKPTFPNTPDQNQSMKLSSLMNLEINDLPSYSTLGVSRTDLLEILVEYYSIHFEGIGKIHSLPILKEVFH